MAKRSLALACALSLGAPTASAVSTSASANPIRKVVNLLQGLQKKVVAEGEKADELFNKYECYCTETKASLSASITASVTKVAELGPSIEAATSKKSQLDKDLVSHKADRKAAGNAMEEATALRAKEKDAFDKGKADSQTNLASLTKAVAALEKGMGDSFLQSEQASSLKALVTDSESVAEGDRQTLLAFLDATHGEGYLPASGEITGILKQMRDEMSQDLKEMIATEDAAVASYNDLIAAKKKEVAALSKAIEDKLSRVGDLGVEIASMQNDLEDTQETLAEDKAFLADLEKNCATKASVREEEKNARAAELLALSETIKILNDDSALDLFKKTLPSSAPSFLQVQRTAAEVRADAKAVVDKARAGLPAHQRPRLDFIALALHGRKAGFDEILKLVDELVASLKTEQQGDDDKKAYCEKELDVAEDKQKALEHSLDDIAVAIAETKEGIQGLVEEIKGLKDGIVALDKSVAEATIQRKKENAALKELMSDNGAAKELILFAKNRLAKFYNPALYKPGLNPSFAETDDAPPAPPAVGEAYRKQSEGNGGVMAMMDLLVADLDKEMTIASTEEKNAQKEYEQTMSDSGEKRALDSKSLTDKEASKAGMQASSETSHAQEKSTGKELQAAKSYLMTLHADCDWLMQYYGTRKEARSDEIDSLEKAKAVLSGADYSFLQTASDTARARKFLSRDRRV